MKQVKAIYNENETQNLNINNSKKMQTSKYQQ